MDSSNLGASKIRHCIWIESVLKTLRRKAKGFFRFKSHSYVGTPSSSVLSPSCRIGIATFCTLNSSPLQTPLPCILGPANEKEIKSLESCLHFATIIIPSNLRSIGILQNTWIQVCVFANQENVRTLLQQKVNKKKKDFEVSSYLILGYQYCLAHLTISCYSGEKRSFKIRRGFQRLLGLSVRRQFANSKWNGVCHGALQQEEMKAGSAQAESCVYVEPNFFCMHGIIPQLFDCWADPVVHLLILKSSMHQPMAKMFCSIRP